MVYWLRSLENHEKPIADSIDFRPFHSCDEPAASAAKCDRACLDKTVDAYIAAMVAHDPSKVAFAPDVKFVENTVPMKPGEGLWKTASEGPDNIQDLCSRSGGAAGGFPGCDERAR